MTAFDYYHVHKRMRGIAAFCLHVLRCLSEMRSNFWKPWPRKFIRDMEVHLQNIRVKFIYQGHRVKVKVTGQKSLSVYSVRGWSAFDWKAILFPDIAF